MQAYCHGGASRTCLSKELQQNNANQFVIYVELLCHHVHSQSVVALHKVIHFADVISSFCYRRLLSRLGVIHIFAATGEAFVPLK